LVHRRRGGYCYELPAQTHHVLSVTVPGVDGPLLVDVGFGGQTLTSPIRLEADPV
jgi:arylamine N-acetyltransferase